MIIDLFDPPLRTNKKANLRDFLSPFIHLYKYHLIFQCFFSLDGWLVLMIVWRQIVVVYRPIQFNDVDCFDL